jgi:DNA polymerase-3 subunit epsilon
LTAEFSLVRRAARLLQEGSVHTLELARQVLGLSGNAGAASAAVFALLGSDSRFEVDGKGWWSLVGDPPAHGEELEGLSYAVVDVETTGGTPRRGHRITEVAVVEVEAGVIASDFQTLVNPGRPIPSRIATLTGITNDMVAGAPFFEDIAEELLTRLEGRVFVAHNVSFDWSFVSAQLGDSLGEVPNGPRLCTIQMARRLAPALKRRNLDAVATHFEVPIHARHRAYGDAMATARVLLRLLDEARLQGIPDLPTLQQQLSRKRSS